MKTLTTTLVALALTLGIAFGQPYKPVYNYDPYVAMEFNMGQPLQAARIVPVSLGKKEKGFAFIFSADPNVDPSESSIFFPKHPPVIAVFDLKGKELWRKELTYSIPGVWFVPLLPMDMDGDGADELYYVNNIGEKPFMYKNFKLTRADIRTGEVTGQWPWPEPTHNQANSYKWRFFLIGGYAKDGADVVPVLVEGIGTYHDMRLVGLNSDMSKRWEVYYPDDENGPRGSHSNALLALDGDGNQQFMYGERCIGFEDGKELFVLDGDKWYAHSDVVLPIYDNKTHQWDYWTVREKGDDGKLPRAVMFGPDAKQLWAVPDMWGHWHYGWVGNVGENGERIAMAGHYPLKGETGNTFNFYDPKTGKVLPPVAFPFDSRMMDFNGDGVHEAAREGALFDRRGTKIFSAEKGSMIACKHILDLPGEQLTLMFPDGRIQIWADRNAKDEIKNRYDEVYMINLRHNAVGYNNRFPILNY